MNPTELQRLDRFVITLIFWCTLATVLTLGVQRVNVEWQDRRVEIAYPEKQLLTQSLVDPQAPKRLLAAGATTLVREPYTLADLMNYHLAVAWHPEPARLQIQLADSQLSGNAAIYLGGQLGFSNLRIRIRNNQYLFDLRLPAAVEDINPERFIMDISKGSMPPGFRRALRLPAGDWAQAADLNQLTRALASLRPQEVIADWRGGAGAVSFYRAYLNTPWLRAPILVLPEFSLPPAGELVLRRAPRHYLVRAYRLTEDAFLQAAPATLTLRLVRAVRERGVRFLHLEFPASWTFTQQQAYTQTLTQALKKSGYEPGALSKQRRFRTGALAQVFLFFAMGAFCYFFIWRWARWAAAITGQPGVSGPVRVIRLRAKYFRWTALGLALVLMVLQFEGPAQWGAKLGAWLLAIMAPLLGISQTDLQPEAVLEWKAWLRTISREFALILAWALGAAAIIAILLYQPEFVQRLNVFTGVKAAIAVPMALGMIYLFPALLNPGWWKERIDRKHRWVTLLWIACLGVGIGIVLLRTGNLTWFPGRAWELQWRDGLETFFGVRPRFKEFLIGYPLLWVGLGARRMQAFRNSAWPKWCLWAGLLGPISLINTFCHLHTPLLISGLRSFHGLWVGSLLGAAGLWAVWQWNKRR